MSFESESGSEDEFVERERRFLVEDRGVVAGASWQLLTQAYVFALDGFSIRVRLVEEPTGDSDLATVGAWLTAKGPDHGFNAARKRQEFETRVDAEWARQVITRSTWLVQKRRYHVLLSEAWDIDQFLGSNDGLWIAEVEGQDAIERLKRPRWAGAEISKDTRYDNDYLAQTPWTTWDQAEG